MKVGFTGTRAGMSIWQIGQLSMLLQAFYRATKLAPEFHHGGAEGADVESDSLAISEGYRVTVHPCPGVAADDGDNGRLVSVREFVREVGYFNGHRVEWDQVFPPLVRNKRIVEAVDVLIAAPRTDVEELRSGTWATVRYARKAGKPVVMLSRGTP